MPRRQGLCQLERLRTGRSGTLAFWRMARATVTVRQTRRIALTRAGDCSISISGGPLGTDSGRHHGPRETVGVPSGFESAHLSTPFAGRLMRDFGSIVGASLHAMSGVAKDGSRRSVTRLTRTDSDLRRRNRQHACIHGPGVAMAERDRRPAVAGVAIGAAERAARF